MRRQVAPRLRLAGARGVPAFRKRSGIGVGIGIGRAVSADGREGKRGWTTRCRFLGDVEACTTRAASRRERRRSRGAWRGVRDGTREIRERRRKTRASCPPTARLDRSFLVWHQSEAPRKAHKRRFSPRGARGGDAPPVLLLFRNPALDRGAARRRRGVPAHRGADASHRPSHLTVTRAIAKGTPIQSSRTGLSDWTLGERARILRNQPTSEAARKTRFQKRREVIYVPQCHTRLRASEVSRSGAHAQRRTETVVARWTARSA